MSRSKLSVLLAIFLLIAVGTFTGRLEAQNTEEKAAAVQEFIKAAQEFVKLNQFKEAIELYERIVIAAPEHLESRVQLATLYTRTKQHEKAVQTYSKLLETDPENIKYQDVLVNSLQAAGKRNEALDIAQAYIQTHPEVGIHYARLARLYDAEGNEAAAITNYEKATAFGHSNKKIYLRLVEHYFLNEDLAATEKALKNAMLSTTSERERERIERQLIYLYLYQGNLEEMSQKAEAEGTLTFEMQNQRARHFHNTGDLEKAAVHFKKALEMTNISSRRNDIANRLIDVYLKQNRTDLALDFYKTEISKQSRSKFSGRDSSPGITFRFVGDDARQTLINAYKNQGKLEELRILIESKLEKDLDNLAILELLAEIYWNTNNYQKAAETYHVLSISNAESNCWRRYIAVYQSSCLLEK